MIDFDLSVPSLVKIRRESKLFNLRTRYNYLVRAAAAAAPLRVLPEIVEVTVSDEMSANVTKGRRIVLFLQANGVPTRLITRTRPEPEYEWEEVDAPDATIEITLGVRLLAKIVLASAVLSTIVYYMEGRLSLPAGCRLPPIPKL